MRRSETHPSTAWGPSFPDAFVDGLFRPQIVLPSQYFGRPRGMSEKQGELRLMLAVLQDAINCYLSEDGKAVRLFEEAQEWITAADQSAPFSFDNICFALDIEPQLLRKKLETLRSRSAAETAAKWKLCLKSVRRPGAAVARTSGSRRPRRFSPADNLIVKRSATGIPQMTAE